MTAEPRQGIASLEETAAHQALFGYRNGHRLVASSTAFEPHVLDVLNRTTDGTGAESIAGFDGYLSGFPLADGRYVLTRTWKAPEAGRPGAVWTHAVLLDLLGQHADVDASRYVGLLRRPDPEARTLNDFAVPIRPLSTPAPAPRRVVNDWTARLSALYANDSATVWFPAAAAHEAEAEVVDVWTWHWPALRRRLSFCLGALSKRTVGGTPFDILVVPATRKVTAVSDLGPEPSGATPTGTLVAADLKGEVPISFGQFIRFCGAETQRRTAVTILSEAWLLADDPGSKPLRALQRLTERVAQEFPEARMMRRLKRALLVRDGRLPSPWSTADQLRVLLEPTFANSVRASDAPLLALLEENQRNPTLLLEAAVTYGGLSRAKPGSKTATVADVLGEMTTPILARNAQPSWLPEVAGAGVELAAQILRAAPVESRSGWADEFWALDEGTRAAMTDLYSLGVPWKDNGAPGFAASLGWLAAYGKPKHSVAWFLFAHTTSAARVAGAVDLAAELSRRGADARRGYVGSFDDQDLIGSCFSAARKQPAPTKQMLLLLIDPASALARPRGLEPWLGALDGVSPDAVAAAHLLRMVPRDEPSRLEIQLAAVAYAHVWEAVARSDWRTWDALGSYPATVPRDDEWDRAMRVSRSFARQVAIWVTDAGTQVKDNTLPTEVLSAVSSLSGRAADQLSAELANVFSPPQRKVASSKKKNKKNPVERAWQMAADMLGFD